MAFCECARPAHRACVRTRGWACVCVAFLGDVHNLWKSVFEGLCAKSFACPWLRVPRIGRALRQPEVTSLVSIQPRADVAGRTYRMRTTHVASLYFGLCSFRETSLCWRAGTRGLMRGNACRLSRPHLLPLAPLTPLTLCYVLPIAQWPAHAGSLPSTRALCVCVLLAPFTSLFIFSGRCLTNRRITLLAIGSHRRVG